MPNTFYKRFFIGKIFKDKKKPKGKEAEPKKIERSVISDLSVIETDSNSIH